MGVKLRDCRHKNRATCHCDGRAPFKIVRCPSNADKNCKVSVYGYSRCGKRSKDTGYNPSWEQIKRMLGEND